jgi:hypothetical protein
VRRWRRLMSSAASVASWPSTRIGESRWSAQYPEDHERRCDRCDLPLHLSPPRPRCAIERSPKRSTESSKRDQAADSKRFLGCPFPLVREVREGGLELPRGDANGLEGGDRPGAVVRDKTSPSPRRRSLRRRSVDGASSGTPTRGLGSSPREPADPRSCRIPPETNGNSCQCPATRYARQRGFLGTSCRVSVAHPRPGDAGRLR